MKPIKAMSVVLGVIVALAAGTWLAKDYLRLHIGGWLAPRAGPNRPVPWSQGPVLAAPPPDQRAPNIILILADDLGFNDIRFNGGGVADGVVPTPNIDAIGQEGVAFTNGYAGDATCAPSRAAIMTGRYPTRFGFEFTPTPVGLSRLVGSFHSPGTLHAPHFNASQVGTMPDLDREAIPASEITIAEVLKARGYHTIHLGKWHLGGARGARPEQKGFDESLGFISGASMYLPGRDPAVENAKQAFDPIDRFLWANLPYAVQFNGGKPFRPNAYMTDYLTDQALSAIQANRNRPFFLYLAYNAVHTPLQAPKADFDALPQIKDHRLRVYAAMIRDLDRNVGRVLGALKDQGLDRNTLVIFTSDNGGANYIGLPEINRPYRGWKATFFEGGVHVPFFMRWPAVLPAGARYPAPVAHIDIFSTALAAAGASVPRDRAIDGVNLLPFLTGKAAGRPHEVLFWRSGHYKVVLAGEWKLQSSERPNKLWLFDLASDPSEQHNLADTNPAKTHELAALIAEQDRQSVKPLWPSLLEAPVAIDHPLGVPDKPGDEYVYWDN